MRRILLLFIVIPISCAVHAQVSRSAGKAYNKALTYRAQHDPVKAESAARVAIRQDPAFIEAYILLSKWLMDEHQYRPAAELLSQGEKSCKDGGKIFAKSLTICLLQEGNYAGALQRISPNATDSGWRRLQAQAYFMQLQMTARKKDTVKPQPVGPPGAINTTDAELFPFRSGDGNIFYFTRRVNGQDEDFFYALRDTCDGWQSGKAMPSPPNTPAQEAAQSISADGHYLFFMRCDNRSATGWDQGGCDLYMAYTADSIWSNPQSFGGTINTPDFEGMPCLSSDNRELFFVSNRPGGYGGLDIWSSRFEHGLWQLPRNLGPAINTAGDELSPFVYADNQTLYFASNGHTGMGGSDLFISRRTNDTTWSAAENMGIPFNTPDDELSLSLNAHGDTAYFATDHFTAAGNYDIYQLPLPAELQPKAITFMKGFVYDSVSQRRLNYANTFITDSATGVELYQVQSNRGDGSYSIALPVGKTYYLFTDRMAYQAVYDTIRCYQSHIDSPVIKNIALLAQDYVKPVTDSLVLTLYFARSSTELADTDKARIADAIKPWAALPDITVFVNGYTDDSGTPLINEQYSYTRARLTGAEVQAAGIHGEMITVKGWGETNPVAENDTDEHRDKNRRVEVVIRR